MPGYMTRALRSNDSRYAKILSKLGYATKPMVESEPVSHENQGTSYDPGAAGHELQGRQSAPTGNEDNKIAAQQLLNRAGNMSPSTLRRQAKRILGEDLPNNKNEILDALKAAAK